MKFLGNVLAVIVGLFIFSILSILISFGILGAVVASEDKEVTVKESSLLHINLNGRSIVERTNENDLNLAGFGALSTPMTAGMYNLKKAIRGAAEDENIKGIYLNAGLVFAGQASLLELRNTLEEFKKSGKFIVAYDEAFSEGGYYLASVADELYINPLGGIDFNGLASETIFMTGFFEKVGIKPVVFRVGDFKSAVEPFILKQMSPANRLQTESFLNDINSQALEGISESLNMDLDSLTLINDQMLVRAPEDAVKYGLATAEAYEEDVFIKIREKLGLEEDAKIPTMKVTEFNKTVSSKNLTSNNRIAVILAEGQIVSGSAPGFLSSDIFAEEIKKARKNDNIDAIVLRVNSPGGSILASEVIWKEMVEAKKAKPLIVSMGEVAASGGYYISAPADTIVAQPNTITGSIGIFGLFFNVEELVTDKLGITTDVVETGELSDFMNPGRELTQVEKDIMQKNIDDGYETFISKVVEGRGMTEEQVKAVASGRVWTGTQAKERGLVDVLGGLDTAIEIASGKIEAGDDYRVVYYPEQKPWFEVLMKDLENNVSTRIIQSQLGDAYPYFQKVQELKHLQGIQVRMPQEIIIK